MRTLVAANVNPLIGEERDNFAIQSIYKVLHGWFGDIQGFGNRIVLKAGGQEFRMRPSNG
jgi:hypothetical protein